MCNYHCPFAERRAVAGFLLCRDCYKEGVNYNVRQNAMNVICAFQKQCMRTGKMENTDTARSCYEMRMKAKSEAASEAVEKDAAEEIPAEPAPKAAKKKKKS